MLPQEQKSPGISESELQLTEHRITNIEFNFLNAVKTGPISFKETNLKPIAKIKKSTKEIFIYIDFFVITNEEGNDLFNLKISYYAHFQASGATTDEQLEKFAQMNAPAIVFPTMRSCIATITLAANFPPLTLPIINFAKLPVPVEFI